MLRRLASLLLLTLCATSLPAAQLTRLGAGAEPTFQAVPGGRVLVRQVVEVHLAAGGNELTFVLPTGGVTPDQVRLRPVPPEVTVTATEAPRENPTWVRWLVAAPAAAPARFVLSYPVPELTWEPVYALRTGPTQATWEAWVRVVNKGTSSWEQVRLTGLPWAEPTVSVPAGADARFPLATFTGLPVSSALRYEPDRYGEGVVELLTLPRVEGPFAAAAIPPGRLEILEDTARPGVPAQALNVPYTQRGRDLILSRGPTAGLSVGRRLVSARQVNVRLDVDGRPALYDLDEQYEIVVANRRAAEVTLTFIERLAGAGEVVEATQPWQPYDATHVRFELTVPAQTDLRTTYRLLRSDLEP